MKNINRVAQFKSFYFAESSRVVYSQGETTTTTGSVFKNFCLR